MSLPVVWSGFFLVANRRPDPGQLLSQPRTGVKPAAGGDSYDLLSIDRFLRFIIVPPLFAAFVVASQISAALSPD
jgi:hypothetical protein